MQVLLILSFTLGVMPVLCVVLWTLYHRSSQVNDKGGGEQACGHCGYSVRGLTTFACPECGSDLRTVGIRAANAGKTGFRRSAKAWTLLWIALQALTMFLMEALERERYENFLFKMLAWSFLAWIGGLIWMLRPHAGRSPSIAARPAQASASSPPADKVATITRNLSIMFIDIVDFTALAERETRDGLLVVIRRARDMVNPVIAKHQGKLVKTMGDGFLVTFESPTNAVLCGRELQSDVAQRADSASGEEQALRYRIGIATGEVAMMENDVYGDHVNLAARIQQLASAGDVLFSESTYHAMTRSEVPHEVAGEFELKGIARQVTLYRAGRAG